MKKVSVILTTYNSERFIKRAIDSILNQVGVGKEFEIELIVVDDCSTDTTIEILNNYSIKLLVTKSNSGGPNIPRNIGIKTATGNYLCIADHDDEWEKDKIITLLPYLNKVPIVSSGYTLIDSVSGEKIQRVSVCSESYQYFQHDITFLNRLKKSSKGQNTYLGSLIYDSKLKDILFEENFGMVDFDWKLRLFYQNDSIEVSKSLYKKHVSDSNLSVNENYRRIDFYYSLMFLENYREAYPYEYYIAYKKIHGSRARYYYIINDMKLARFYFLRSGLSMKNIAYYITTFVGSKFVKRKFKVFG